MKKTIQFLIFTILILVLSGIIIFFFNPFNLRNKMIGSMINYCFQINKLEQTGTIDNTKNLDKKIDPQINEIMPADKNPLLTEEQEKKLESYGVDVEALPKEISPGMIDCFTEKLGEERATEIANGATPGPLEIIRTKDCLSK